VWYCETVFPSEAAVRWPMTGLPAGEVTTWCCSVGISGTARGRLLELCLHAQLRKPAEGKNVVGALRCRLTMRSEGEALACVEARISALQLPSSSVARVMTLPAVPLAAYGGTRDDHHRQAVSEGVQAPFQVDEYRTR
jgi:hypothetical protein